MKFSSGNFIPDRWAQWVRYANKRGDYPDFLAMHILSDVVHCCHLITEVKRSPEYYAKAYGISARQARESMALLEQLGLIRINRKSVSTEFGVVPNVSFVAPVFDVIEKITADTEGGVQS